MFHHVSFPPKVALSMMDFVQSSALNMPNGGPPSKSRHLPKLRAAAARRGRLAKSSAGRIANLGQPTTERAVLVLCNVCSNAVSIRVEAYDARCSKLFAEAADLRQAGSVERWRGWWAGMWPGSSIFDSGRHDAAVGNQPEGTRIGLCVGLRPVQSQVTTGGRHTCLSPTYPTYLAVL
jgi:hypothetical protein